MEASPRRSVWGRSVFPRYVIAMVLIQHLLFFAFESLSWAHIFHTLVRLVVSSAVNGGLRLAVCPFLPL